MWFRGLAHHLAIPIRASAKPYSRVMCLLRLAWLLVAGCWERGSGLALAWAARAGWLGGQRRTGCTVPVASPAMLPVCCAKQLGLVASWQGGLYWQAGADVEASRHGALSSPCWKSRGSEWGCVKRVSWRLLARLLVRLHHLPGGPCQLAHLLGKFKEAYRNLTRNLSSSINLLVFPHLLSTCSFAHSF